MALHDVCAQDACIHFLESLDAYTQVVPENVDINAPYGTFRAVKESSYDAGVVVEKYPNPLGKAAPTGGALNLSYHVQYYKQRNLTLGNSATDDGCTSASAETLTPLVTEVTVEATNNQVAFSKSLNEYRDNCESYTRDLMKLMEAAKRKFLERLNDRWADLILAGAGNYFTESGAGADSITNPESIYLFSDVSGDRTPRASAWLEFSYQMERLGGMGQSTMVGGKDVWEWFRAQPIYAGDTEGRDGSRYNDLIGARPHIDWRLDANTAGSGRILSWVNGYVTPIFHTDYDGELAVISQEVTRTTIDLAPEFARGNVRGLPVNLHVYTDYCAKPYPQITYTFEMFPGLFVMPDDAFNTATGQVPNGILNWTAACGEVACAT